MDTETLRVIVEAVTQLSTMVFFVLLLALFASYMLATLFALDVLAILLAALLQRYAEHHLAIRPMAERLGRPPPYKRGDRTAVYNVFLRGLEAAGVTPPSAPPNTSDR
ncbi:hypothetical protein [Rubrivirga sp.]|uniref:hypothetical protein n=1 Tax=Rubrivirga sp. TaxID=1885344 RepID=UPI003C790C1F